MNYRLSFGLLFIFNLAFGQQQQITKLDGSKISAYEIDKTVKRLMDTAKIQGLGLAILNNKKTIFIKSYRYKKNLIMN
jgi:LDH2 family malate/lactate/ureidoglycolate dehydrogenase